MRRLEASDRRDAEKLALIFGVELDQEFEQLRVKHLPSNNGVPKAQQSALATSSLFELNAVSTKLGLICKEVILRYLSQQQGIQDELQRFLASQESFGANRIEATPETQRSDTETAFVVKEKTSFKALIDKWASGVPLQKNTISRTRMHARRFEEMSGVHTIEEVTRQHAIRFVKQLRKNGQTPQNINMLLASLIKLLNYAVRLDLVKANEASGLSVKALSGEKARRSFDLPALKSIFSSPIYTAEHRPKGDGGEASYWLPLLALVTGARLEELCQLHPDDVMQVPYHHEGGEASAWIMRITDEGEGQGIKNVGICRRIPLHPELERLGFVEYVQEAKNEGRKRIFHKLVPALTARKAEISQNGLVGICAIPARLRINAWSSTRSDIYLKRSCVKQKFPKKLTMH